MSFRPPAKNFKCPEAQGSADVLVIVGETGQRCGQEHEVGYRCVEAGVVTGIGPYMAGMEANKLPVPKTSELDSLAIVSHPVV